MDVITPEQSALKRGALSSELRGAVSVRGRRAGGSSKRRENDEMTQMADCIRAVADRKDREAFRQLFTFYAPRLKAFLIKRGAGQGEAEEVMQEAMTLVWRKAEQFDPAKASASTWIYTIARNRRIDLIRRAKRPELDPEDPFFTSIGLGKLKFIGM